MQSRDVDPGPNRFSIHFRFWVRIRILNADTYPGETNKRKVQRETFMFGYIYLVCVFKD